MTGPRLRAGGIPMWLYAGLLSGALSVLALVPAGASGQVTQQTATWRVSDCEDCHDKVLTPAYRSSAHGQADQSCAKCHSNVAEHAQAQTAGRKGPVPSVKNLKANELNETCLSCHEKGKQASYETSMHARRNVACTSCHSVHHPVSAAAQLKTVRGTDACISCHKAERAKSMRTSHHPVREGKMECSSCHNPHEGNSPKMLNAETVNDLCYQCHTEKRGPFVFEHAPVREDCISCHDAHGSNHARMLVQKQPTVCWNCHLTGSGHFGSGDNFSTEKGVPVAPTGAPSGYPTVNSRFVGRSCANCHFSIHGSNSPSGAYFLR
ncbi:MAG: DmsE family decaheme c-type cytochrome [Gemmatimonadetes bacterium]|nr:DmsE family decaheme c-type cytochrome [Gemmatimonadota bacterium]